MSHTVRFLITCLVKVKVYIFFPEDLTWKTEKVWDRVVFGWKHLALEVKSKTWKSREHHLFLYGLESITRSWFLNMFPPNLGEMMKFKWLETNHQLEKIWNNMRHVFAFITKVYIRVWLVRVPSEGAPIIFPMTLFLVEIPKFLINS